MATQEVLVELSKVTKRYASAGVTALRDVDLTIRRGEFLSVMGPSGSGKSTLLNLISALDVPSSGSIRIQGQDTGALDDDRLTLFRRTHIGLVFQFFNLLPTLDALDNVLLPVMLARRASPEDRARAVGLLETIGLKDRMHHGLQELSGGEMQRVAIARALIHRPSLVLADEPTGNLDTTTSGEILELLRSTCEREATTVVMVTHDHAAAAVGHRLVQLKDGAIVGDVATNRATGGQGTA